MKSLQKIFEIIEILKDHKELRLHEIVSLSSINKSTAHRILNELIKENYVQFNKDNKRYRLGLKFLEITNFIMEDITLIRAAKEIIDELNNLTKETIHLALMNGDKAVYVDKRESKNAIRMYSSLGKEVLLYCSAIGKAILASTSAQERDKIIEKIQFVKYTNHTITNAKDLKEEIEKIQKQNYSIDNEEREENIFCIGSAIKDHKNEVVGAISITLTLYSVNFKNPEIYKDLIINAAKRISRNLGYIEKK